MAHSELPGPAYNVLPSRGVPFEEPKADKSQRPRPWRRFLSAFLVAIVVWVLLTILILSTVYFFCPGEEHMRPPVTIEDTSRYEVPKGVHLESCIHADEWNTFLQHQNYSSVLRDNSLVLRDYPLSKSQWEYTAFNLPISSETLFILSRGKNLVGTVEFSTSPYQAEGYIAVQVLMYSSSIKALGGTKACLVTRGVHENGVGIFTPTTWSSDRFNSHHRISVILPEVIKSRSRVYIKNFVTDVPGSGHSMESLNEKVFFDKISLNGSDGFVTIKSLAANTAEIRTTHVGIRGKFDITQSLLLSTNYSDITADVNLTSKGRSEPTFIAETKGGILTANVNLVSTPGWGGKFFVAATTVGQYLSLRIPKSAPLSELHLNVSTKTLSPTMIFLNPEYEGKFDLHAGKYEGASLTVDPYEQRIVQYEGEGNMLSGNVSWIRDYHARGSVSVTNSNGGISLSL